MVAASSPKAPKTRQSGQLLLIVAGRIESALGDSLKAAELLVALNDSRLREIVDALEDSNRNLVVMASAARRTGELLIEASEL